MAGRFNKILEFIGLVDDEPEEEFDQARSKPAGGQTYGAQPGRRAPQREPARYPRGYEYEAGRGGGRYTSSPRPDFDARQRRDSYNTPPPRYGADQRGGAAPRGDYPPPARDYAAPGRDYASFRQTDYRSSRADPLEDEFERAANRAPRGESAARGNVVPMRAQPASGHQTVIYYLRNLEECRDVINDLLESKSVLLNLEDMDERAVQRSIDTLCGAAFALGATLRKASDKTYLIAPNNVMVASTNDDGRRY